MECKECLKIDPNNINYRINKECVNCVDYKLMLEEERENKMKITKQNLFQGSKKEQEIKLRILLIKNGLKPKDLTKTGVKFPNVSAYLGRRLNIDVLNKFMEDLCDE